VRVRRGALPQRQTTMLLIRDRRGHVLLTRRPSTGLWGGLWSFPECASPAQATAHCRQVLGLRVTVSKPWPDIEHSFSHFRLRIRPLPVRLSGPAQALRTGAPATWINPAQAIRRGLASPVQTLLERLCAD